MWLCFCETPSTEALLSLLFLRMAIFLDDSMLMGNNKDSPQMILCGVNGRVEVSAFRGVCAPRTECADSPSQWSQWVMAQLVVCSQQWRWDICWTAHKPSFSPVWKKTSFGTGRRWPGGRWQERKSTCTRRFGVLTFALYLDYIAIYKSWFFFSSALCSTSTSAIYRVILGANYLQGILGKVYTLLCANERLFEWLFIISYSELQRALGSRPNTHIWSVPRKY